MAAVLDKLRRLRVFEQSTFSEDGSGTLSNYLDFNPIEGSINFQRNTASLPVRCVRQRRNQTYEDVLGPKQASLDFQAYLCGHGLDLDGDVAVPTKSTWWQARMLGAMYGGIDTETIPAAQTTVQAGTTTTVVNVTAGHGTRFKKGVAIGCVTANGYEAREVLSVSTDAVSVKVAFSGIPTTGQPVRRSVTIFRANSPATWLSFAEEGAQALDRWHCRGMQGAVSFGLTWGEPLTWSASLKGPSWANLGSGSLAVPTILYDTKIVMSNVEMLLATVGSTTRTVIGASGLEIVPDMPWEMQHGTSGTSAVETVVTQIAGAPADSPLTIKITEPFEDLSRFTSRDSSTDHALFTQFGNTVGATFLHSAPTGQLINPEMGASEAFRGNIWTLKCREDASGALSADIDYAAERLHFL